MAVVTEVVVSDSWHCMKIEADSGGEVVANQSNQAWHRHSYFAQIRVQILKYLNMHFVKCEGGQNTIQMDY